MDETGKYLGYFLIRQVTDPEGSYKAINDAIDKYDIQVVAVGNGTGSQEVQAIVSKVISENYTDVMYTVVDESGASVYSASKLATEEFPDYDVALFYYAGHGFECNGHNLLMPVDTNGIDAGYREWMALDLNYLINALEGKNHDNNLKTKIFLISRVILQHET